MAVEIDKIIRSKRKTIALIVRPDGSLLVRAPQRASHRSIQEFAAKNIDWIERTRSKIKAVSPPPPKQFIPGERFEYLGSFYPLEIVESQKKDLVLEEGRFRLAHSVNGNAASVFENWYREQAKWILKERVDFYASRHGFQYSKIGITSARTRWGSCSRTGALNFSWRLILAPLEAVDYVVLHELVHTVVHDHSRKFWKELEQAMPEYKERRKWLKQNGHRLLV